MMRRFRHWLGKRLRKLASWVTPHDNSTAMMFRALDLVQVAEKLPDNTSGEYKRHCVYAQLIKDFPGARPRDLAIILESAVQEAL